MEEGKEEILSNLVCCQAYFEYSSSSLQDSLQIFESNLNYLKENNFELAHEILSVE